MDVRSTLSLLAIVAALLTTGGCSEKPQAPGSTSQADAMPAWKGSTVPRYDAPGWKAGSESQWDAQLRRRAQNQNEHVRIGS